MPQATFINPQTKDRKAAEVGSRQAEDLFAADYVLEQTPGVAVQATSPTDPRLRDLNVQPPLTPQGTGSIRDINTGLTNTQAQTPAAQPNVPSFAGSGTDYSKFGSIITDLLKAQQNLGTDRFQEQEFGAMEEQIRRNQISDPDLIGASPSIQSAARGYSVAAVQPTVQGAQQARKTFSEQIAGLGNAIAQARGVGQWMQQVDSQKQQQAIDFLYKFPGAIQSLAETDEKVFREFAKSAGVTPEMIMAIPEQTDQTDRTALINLAGDYIDAGIDPDTDTYATATEKIKANSQIYRNEVGLKVIDPTTPSTGGIVKDASGNYFDIGNYAIDETHPASVQQKLNEIGKMESYEQMDSYIQSKFPGSPITGEMIGNASAQSGASWEMIMAMADKESNMGTSNVANNNNNFGGTTWSQDYENRHPGSSKGTARPAIEGGHYVKFDSLQNGLNAMAEGLGGRKTDAPPVTAERAYKDSILAQVLNGMMTKGDYNDARNEFKDDASFLQELTKAASSPKNRTLSQTEVSKFNVPALTTTGQLDAILAARQAAGLGNRAFQGLHDSTVANKNYDAIITTLEKQQDLVNIRAIKEGWSYMQNLSDEEKDRIWGEYGDIMEADSIEELSNYNGVNTGKFTAKGWFGLPRQEALEINTKQNKLQVALDIISGKNLVEFMKDISGVAISEPEARRLATLVPSISQDDDRFKKGSRDLQEGMDDALIATARKYGFDSIDAMRWATEQTQSGNEYSIGERGLIEAQANIPAASSGVLSSGLPYTIE